MARKHGLIRLHVFGGMAIGDSSDALVNQTADGVDLSTIWEEVKTVVGGYNQLKDGLVSLLTYATTNPADAIPQDLRPSRMELASEGGVPRSIPPEVPYLKVGYTFRDYDLRSGLGWKFIRDASAEQVRAQITRLIEADKFTVQSTVLQRMLDGTEDANEWSHRCFGTYTGADSIKPPSFMGNVRHVAHALHRQRINGSR